MFTTKMKKILNKPQQNTCPCELAVFVFGKGFYPNTKRLCSVSVKTL